MAAATSLRDPGAGIAPRPYRLSYRQYEQLCRSGIVGEDEPVYLWDGRLVEDTRKGRPHVVAVACLYRLLVDRLPAGWFPFQEQPFLLDDASVPEPDLSVARGGPRDYRDRPPTPDDVALIVEVADSTLPTDLGEKLAAYARAGVPSYWVVNLPARRVEAHGGPEPSAGAAYYRSRQTYGPDDEIPLMIEGREVGRLAVRDLLP